MRFLLDQDVYAVTNRFLRELGHDVISAAELGLSQASDLEVLNTAQSLSRILVTRDRDFGGLAFVNKLGAGIVYLRILPSNLSAVHDELQSLLVSRTETELMNAFVVVEAGRHRFRRLS